MSKEESAIVAHAPHETNVVPLAQSDSLIQVIARAASDPLVDIDKMERLIVMQERIQSKEAKAAYYSAMSEMQPELPVITERGGIKGRDGKVQSTYALWEDVNESLRPVLSKFGFSLTFKVKRTDSEIVTTGILAHRFGHLEETELSLPSDTSGSKNAVQAIGSSASYGKRYTAFALLNITSEAEDDDGVKAGRTSTVNQTQYEHLRQLIADTKTDEGKFCAYVGVEDLTQLPSARYEDACRAIMRKKP